MTIPEAIRILVALFAIGVSPAFGAGNEVNSDCAFEEEDRYRCLSGRCIPKDWLCDGHIDCPDRDDEFHNECEPGSRVENDGLKLGAYLFNSSSTFYFQFGVVVLLTTSSANTPSNVSERNGAATATGIALAAGMSSAVR